MLPHKKEWNFSIESICRESWLALRWDEEMQIIKVKSSAFIGFTKDTVLVKSAIRRFQVVISQRKMPDPIVKGLSDRL